VHRVARQLGGHTAGMCVKVLEDRLKKNYSDLNPNADFSSFRLSFQSKKGHSSRIEFFLEYNDYENI
jgi:hypothetical protein